MKKKTVIIAILIIMLLAAVPLCAESASSRVNAYTVDTGQTNNENIIGVMNYLDIKGSQKGNVIAISSQSASVSGRVEGLFANASNTTVLSGEFKRDVFAYSTIMNISNASFYDDLYVISGYSFASDEGCVYNDNVYIYCAESVVLRGHLKGDVVIKANSVTVDGQIDNNLTVYSDNIQLSQNAKIKGNFNYFSSLNASIDGGAQIAGKINQTIVPVSASSGALNVLSFGIAAFRIFFIIFLAWVFKRVSPAYIESCANLLRARAAASFFAGFGILIATPIVIILLIAFVFTIIPGIFLLGIYAFTALISIIPFASILADRIGVFEKGSLWGLFVSVCIVTILGYVPYVGFVITFLATCMGMGCIFIRLINRMKNKAI